MSRGRMYDQHFCILYMYVIVKRAMYIKSLNMAIQLLTSWLEDQSYIYIYNMHGLTAALIGLDHSLPDLHWLTGKFYNDEHT